jgi:hypothetical protein
LLLVFLVANVRQVADRATPIWDASSVFAPYYTLLADYARAGRLLLWNPWTNGGSPDFADPQVGALSPVVVALAAATGGTLAGFRVYWLLMWFLSGLGILLLGRHLHTPAWGASVAAGGFLFSGFLVGHAEHTSWLYSFAWFPLMIWRLDEALRSDRCRPGFEAGALWGLSGVAGYPGVTCANGIFALLWALGRWLCPRPAHGTGATSSLNRTPDTAFVPITRLLRSMTILFVVGVLVMSPAYVGFLVEGRGFSDRADPLSREEAIGANALHPLALTTIFSPYLGSLPPRTLWPYTDMSSASVYMGAAVLWLAIVSLAARPRDRWRWWLFGVAMLAIGLALGQSLPLRGWLYDLLPPTRYFRHSSLFRAYTIFYLTALALLATSDLGSTPVNSVRRWRLTISAALLAIAAVVSFHLVQAMANDDSSIRIFRSRAHLWGAWLGIVTISVVVDRAPARLRARVLPLFLVSLAVVDAFAAQRLPVTIEDRDPAAVEAWRQLDAHHDPRLDLAPGGTYRVAAVEDPDAKWVSNANLLVKSAVLRGYSPFSNRFHKAWVRNRLLRGAATGDSRFWFAREVGRVAPSDASFEAFVKRSSSLQAVPLVIHPRSAMARTPRAGEPSPSDGADRAAIEALPPAERISVSVTSYWPDRLSFQVVAPSAGWLLVTDRWAHGWRAEVDGRTVPVEPADFIFRAIAVRAGPNRVDFVYHPSGIPWLVVLSWGILATVAGWATTSVCWRWRRATTKGELMLNPGDKAPDFTGRDHTGQTVKLADFKGKTVVLWFYPKADTPG